MKVRARAARAEPFEDGSPGRVSEGCEGTVEKPQRD
jgi:hypothetical protein